MLGEWQLRRFHAMKSLLFESSEQKMTVLEKKKKEKKKKEKIFFWWKVWDGKKKKGELCWQNILLLGLKLCFMYHYGRVKPFLGFFLLTILNEISLQHSI